MKAGRRFHLAGIWAISVWPALNFLGSNWANIERRGGSGLLGVLAITLALGLVGHLFEWRAERRGHYGATCLPWLAVVGLLFSYTPLSRYALITFEDLSRDVSPTLIWWLMVIAAAVVCWLARRARMAIMMATAFGFAVAAMALVRLASVVLSTHGPI